MLVVFFNKMTICHHCLWCSTLWQLPCHFFFLLPVSLIYSYWCCHFTLNKPESQTFSSLCKVGSFWGGKRACSGCLFSKCNGSTENDRMEHYTQYRCHSPLCISLQRTELDECHRLSAVRLEMQSGTGLQHAGRSVRFQSSDKAEHTWTHPFTALSELLSHLLWKLGLWIIWESFAKESTVSTGSSVWAPLCPGWSRMSSPWYKAWSRVLILGRNWARAGKSLSRLCSLCLWFPRLSRTLCLSET